MFGIKDRSMRNPNSGFPHSNLSNLPWQVYGIGKLGKTRKAGRSKGPGRYVY